MLAISLVKVPEPPIIVVEEKHEKAKVIDDMNDCCTPTPPNPPTPFDDFLEPVDPTGSVDEGYPTPNEVYSTPDEVYLAACEVHATNEVYPTPDEVFPCAEEQELSQLANYRVPTTLDRGDWSFSPPPISDDGFSLIDS